MSPSRVKTAGAVLLWCLAAFTVIQGYTRFVPYSLSWNETASIPKGLYWTKAHSGSPVARGDIVCFRFEPPAWAADRTYFPAGYRLCKPVAGLQGDTVINTGSFVSVQAEEGVVAEVSPSLADKQGRPLTTAALSGGPVAANTVVLLAPRYPGSLDSRYLGAIPLSKLTHQIWPLWVYE